MSIGEGILSSLATKALERLSDAVTNKVALRKAWRDPNFESTEISNRLINELKIVVGNVETYDNNTYDFFDYLHSSSFLYFFAACCHRNRGFDTAKTHLNAYFHHYFPNGKIGENPGIDFVDFFEKLKSFTTRFIYNQRDSYIPLDRIEKSDFEELINTRIKHYETYVEDHFRSRNSFKLLNFTPNEELSNLVRKVCLDQIPLFDGITVYGPDTHRREISLDDIFINIPVALEAVDQNQTGIAYKISEAFTYSNTISILGNAGSGKTTIIRNYIHETLKYNSKFGHVFPVFFQIRDLIRQDDLQDAMLVNLMPEKLEYIFRSYAEQNVKPYVNTLLQLGKVVFIFDGLDEIIKPENRIRFSQKINQLVSRFPDCYYIITCRESDYKALRMPNFNTFRVLPFNKEQQEEFFFKFADVIFEKEKSESEILFNRFKIQTEQHVEEFLGNPLLITLLVWIFINRHAIPDDRVKLYRECAELLFQRWDRVREIDAAIEYDQLFFEISARVANYLGSEEILHINHDKLKLIIGEYFEDYFGSSRLQEAKSATQQFMEFLPGRAALIRGTPEGGYEFVHRTFQEYFYGVQIAEQHIDGNSFVEQILTNVAQGKNLLAMKLAIQVWLGGFAGPKSIYICDEIIGFFRKEINMTIRKPNSDYSKEILIVDFCTDVIASIRAPEAKVSETISILFSSRADIKDWFDAANKLLYAYRDKSAAFAQGLSSSIVDHLNNGNYRGLYRIADWIKVVKVFEKIQTRTDVKIYLPTLEKLGHQILEKISVGYKEEPSSALAKIYFDVANHIDADKIKISGQATWDIHEITNNRVDWRFVDCTLCIYEIINVLKYNNYHVKDYPYINLFWNISQSKRIDKPFLLQSAKIATIPFELIKSDLDILFRDFSSLTHECKCSGLLAITMLFEVIEESDFDLRSFKTFEEICDLIELQKNGLGQFGDYLGHWANKERSLFSVPKRIHCYPVSYLVSGYLGAKIVPSC